MIIGALVLSASAFVLEGIVLRPRSVIVLRLLPEAELVGR